MRRFRQLAAALALACAPAAQAGQTCEEQPLAPETLEHAFELALTTRQALDASGAQVALLARVGQDLSKWHLKWSHVGIVWRDDPQGRWLVTHLLNHCGSADSGIYREGLANFYADLPVRWEGLIVIPPPETQARLAGLLRGPLPLALHDAHYNMVAYPFSTQYQNSNQWVLELLAAALADTPITTRTEAQHWLKQHHYIPTTLTIRALTRLGGRMFRANIAFDDHPPRRRWTSQIDTVTVDSVVGFLRPHGVRETEVHYTPPAPVSQP